jgi:ribosomal protein S18 acetylase RimI-like enzyme
MVGPGRPEDAEHLAKLLYETDPKFFRQLPNNNQPSLLGLFADEWRRPGSPLHHAFSRVVREQSQVVGLQVAYTQAEHALLDFNMIGSASEGLPGRILEHLHRVYEVAQYLFPAVPPAAFYIQNLAVADSHRRQGLGDKLMQDAFDRARAADCTTCPLDVDSQTTAVLFYRKLGMEVLVETGVQALAAHGIPTHFRTVKALKK